MFNKCILIGVTLIITLSVVASIQASATIVRNNAKFPVNVTVHFANGGVGEKTIASEASTDVAGDIKQLDVSPSGTQSSVKPAICNGVFSIYAIDISVKDGIIKCE
jgi:hypothetical protein